MHIDDNQNPFSLVADFEGDESSVFEVEMEATLPILPLRNMVLFRIRLKRVLLCLQRPSPKEM